MPPKRKPENRGLPARWVHKNGAYYFLPPAAVRHLWDGKSWFRLGTTLPEAYRAWAERTDAGQRRGSHTVADVLDRYLLEAVPKKGVRTQVENVRAIRNLRAAFGAMAIEDVEPQHVYQYVDARTAKTSAKREVEVFSHVFTKVVEWGLLRRNPIHGQVRLEGEAPRTRYVEDWELEEALSLKPRTGKSNVLMIQAYLRIKLLTGLRQADILSIRVADMKDDGLHVTPRKTAKSSRKRLIYAWTDELRAAVEQAKAVRPVLSPFLFCNRTGACYLDEATGTAKAFNKSWQTFIGRVLEETKLTERFTEHDLRAKVGSDAESLERAQQLLAHADARMTKRVYRRKPEVVAPTK